MENTSATIWLPGAGVKKSENLEKIGKSEINRYAGGLVGWIVKCVATLGSGGCCLCHNIPPCCPSPRCDLISVIWLGCRWRPCRAVRGARVRLRVETQLRFFIGGHSPALTRRGGHGSLNLTGEQRFKRLIGGRFLSFYLHRGWTGLNVALIFSMIQFII